MPHRTLATAIVAAMAFLAVACTGSGRDSRPTGVVFAIDDTTMAKGRTDTLRLGHIYPGEIVQKEFSIVNNTDKPIVVLGYEATCGCTRMIYDDSPLRPGEARRMVCRFDSSGEYGWTLTVLSLNISGAGKRHRLLVECEID